MWSPELFPSTVRNHASEHMRLHLCFAANYQLYENIPWRNTENVAHSPLGKSTFNPGEKSWLPFFLRIRTLIFFSSFFFLRWKPSSYRTEKIGGPYGHFRHLTNHLSIQWLCAALSQPLYECNKKANAHWSAKKRHPQLKLLYLLVRSCAIWSARPAFTEDCFSHCDLNKNWIRQHFSVYGTYSWYRFIVINHQIAIMFYF